MTSALIIVDVQNDFIEGALAVPYATEIILPIDFMARNYDLVIATRDWHPENHISFGQWPKHCVQGTYGAKLHPVIDQISNVIISKGMDPGLEAYSGFASNHLTTVLWGCDKITVVGLATDYCVAATAFDARKKMPFAEVTVDLSGCRGIGVQQTKTTIRAMREAGIKCVGD